MILNMGKIYYLFKATHNPYMKLALSESEKNMSSAIDHRNISENCSAEIVSNLNSEKHA
jgi:hypothetical protein